jgi:hypothetical protein
VGATLALNEPEPGENGCRAKSLVGVATTGPSQGAGADPTIYRKDGNFAPNLALDLAMLRAGKSLAGSLGQAAWPCAFIGSRLPRQLLDCKPDGEGKAEARSAVGDASRAAAALQK